MLTECWNIFNKANGQVAYDERARKDNIPRCGGWRRRKGEALSGVCTEDEEGGKNESAEWQEKREWTCHFEQVLW